MICHKRNIAANSQSISIAGENLFIASHSMEYATRFGKFFLQEAKEKRIAIAQVAALIDRRGSQPCAESEITLVIIQEIHSSIWSRMWLDSLSDIQC
jgi:hypothetical protein